MNNTSQLLVDITRKDLQQTLSNNNKTNEETLILPKVKIELRKRKRNKILIC